MTDRAREGLFSSLGAVVVGARVLDLYAGSGSLGLEALSRGAASAVFVDHASSAQRALAANIATVGLGGVVIADSAAPYLETAPGAFDLVFVDPPYAEEADEVGLVLEHLEPLLAPGGLVVLHRRKGDAPVPVPGWLAEGAIKSYGDTQLYRFERSS